MKAGLPAILLGLCAIAWVNAAEIRIVPDFAGAPLKVEELKHVTDSGQTLEVSRLDFLVTDFALRRVDGSWEPANENAAYCSLGKGRLHVAEGKFEGRYKAARFLVGVNPETNRADANQYSGTHPLNPNVNGLHWGWAGGYVFAAIEGRWQGRGERLHGYSFHIARDENLIRVELPLQDEAVTDLAIHLDVARVFTGIRLDPQDCTTHSRAGDPLAAKLRDNLRAAFSIGAPAEVATEGAKKAPANLLIGPKSTPYSFSFPAYFPKPSLPLDNPLTREGVELGRRLFSDVQLSGNGTQSCTSCHQPERGFSDVTRVSRGADGAFGTRNSMPLENLAWKTEFFWDGRASTLRQQVLMPIENPVEMNARLPDVVSRISNDKYQPAFEAAFGTPEVNADRIARALEQFVLTLVAANSKFDDVMRGKAEFTEEEQRGFDLFHTEFDPRREQFGADCFHCHGGPLFRNMEFANNGLDFETRDWGRAETTGRAADIGKFAVPSLRNIAKTAPYMHDGRFRDLEEVIGFYDRGVRPARTLDPNLAKHPPMGLHLPPEDRRALVAFLRTLSDK